MNSTPQAYCFKCKKKTDGVDGQVKANVRGRKYEVSKCVDCGCKKCRMMKNPKTEDSTVVQTKPPKTKTKSSKKRRKTVDEEQPTNDTKPYDTRDETSVKPEIVIA